MELHPPSPIRLHGVALDYLSKGTTLPSLVLIFKNYNTVTEVFVRVW
jgi:hypothetical protein